MNGYDFDLYFTGTQSDFKELQHAFQIAGVSSQEVRIILKNELEDADTKCAEIKAFLTWLRVHPNRKFDYNAFREENTELFEGVYPYIIVRGTEPEKVISSISIENVDNVQNLKNTVLVNTPIVFFIDEKSSEQFREDLSILLKRPDVFREQLFFMICPRMNRSQVTREISDLGVDMPQVIEQYDAEIVMRYFEDYPIAEYIRKVISVFETKYQQISTVLAVEEKTSQTTNAEIHRQIAVLERTLLRLKEADEQMVRRDNYVAPSAFKDAYQTLMEQIKKWKSRKTKVIGDSDAVTASKDYVANLCKSMQSFYSAIEAVSTEESTRISTEFATIYKNTLPEDDFKPEVTRFVVGSMPAFPDIGAELLALKEITYEEAKEDFFGRFRKTTEESMEPVQVVTYYLEQWRSRASELLLPVAGEYIDTCRQALEQQYDSLAEAYHNQFTRIVAVKETEKNRVSGQLSEDERKLQEDVDWLVAFQDQLQIIERG